jgi:acetyl-CoA carboxylase alpha subunit
MLVGGSLALLGGVALVVVGAQKNKNHKKRTTALTPSFGPRFTGLSLQGRF